MANRKFEDLIADPNTVLSEMAAGDYLLVHDISETLDVRKQKVLTKTNLLKEDYFGYSLALGNGETVITTGYKYDIEIPKAITIDRVTLTSRETGSIVVDICVGTYPTLPTSPGNSICGSAKPTLVSASAYQDSTLTGWTKAVASGKLLSVYVVSVSTFTQCWLHLHGVKNA